MQAIAEAHSTQMLPQARALDGTTAAFCTRCAEAKTAMTTDVVTQLQVWALAAGVAERMAGRGGEGGAESEGGCAERTAKEDAACGVGMSVEAEDGIRQRYVCLTRVRGEG